MSKELPYFRFTASEWLNGDIVLEDPSTKGVFIDVCAYYWFKDCNVSKQVLNKRFTGVEHVLEQLFNRGIIKEKNNGNSIKINFLDEQYKILSDISSSRSKAGKASALKRATSVQQVYQHMNQQSSNYNYNYKDNNNNNNNKDKLSWRDSFELYLEITKISLKELLSDTEEINKQATYYHGIDIKLSIDKAFHNFWGTEAGWKHKKKSRSKDIDMRATLINSININKVYAPKAGQNQVGVHTTPRVAL